MSGATKTKLRVPPARADAHLSDKCGKCGGHGHTEHDCGGPPDDHACFFCGGSCPVTDSNEVYGLILFVLHVLNQKVEDGSWVDDCWPRQYFVPESGTALLCASVKKVMKPVKGRGKNYSSTRGVDVHCHRLQVRTAVEANVTDAWKAVGATQHDPEKGGLLGQAIAVAKLFALFKRFEGHCKSTTERLSLDMARLVVVSTQLFTRFGQRGMGLGSPFARQRLFRDNEDPVVKDAGAAPAAADYSSGGYDPSAPKPASPTPAPPKPAPPPGFPAKPAGKPAGTAKDVEDFLNAAADEAAAQEAAKAAAQAAAAAAQAAQAAQAAVDKLDPQGEIFLNAVVDEATLRAGATTAAQGAALAAQGAAAATAATDEILGRIF